MKLYIAVTPDEYELPLFVTDSAKTMVEWAGISVHSVYEQCRRNKAREPYKRNGGFVNYPHRLRKIIIEEDTP